MDASDGSGNGSNGRQSSSPNIAQRIGRQLSRGILPALRNLVRSNRGQRSGSRSRVAPTEPPQPPTEEMIDIPPIPPLTEDSSQPASSSSESPSCVHNNNTQHEAEGPPPLVDGDDDEGEAVPSEPVNNSLSSALASLNNLMDIDAQPQLNNEGGEGNQQTNPRQRYRLVVYFEERSPEEQPTARYVAVIVGRLDELQFLLSSSSNNERGFGDILNHLFNAYAPKGTPPASTESIDSLPTVTITEEHQSCMICLENFALETEAVVLPCKHMFHGEECVKTWLKLHNSCPVCRYELPVEDTEYESGRKERMMARGFHEGSHTHSAAEQMPSGDNSMARGGEEGERWGEEGESGGSGENDWFTDSAM